MKLIEIIREPCVLCPKTAGIVAAGISAIIIPGNAGYFAVIMGVCAIMLGYTLWDRERNGQIVGKGW